MGQITMRTERKSTSVSSCNWSISTSLSASRFDCVDRISFTYNDTVMCVCVCNEQRHNIFTNLNSEQYSEMMNLLKHAILATDLSLHIQYVKSVCLSVCPSVRLSNVHTLLGVLSYLHNIHDILLSCLIHLPRLL